MQTRAKEVLDQTAKLDEATEALLVTLKKIEDTGSLVEKLEVDQGKITFELEEFTKIVQEKIGRGLKG